ncbi:kelch-like 40 [Plakobranchus ocellatus]|uniref:Kelch-like 40 n=1 Tax=Plakobranchus ocellatus TaxID=259542 RepID=A0AAV4BVA3_9GAST|nr:kelch-like 40 [Plakobranchus ocellatus]
MIGLQSNRQKLHKPRQPTASFSSREGRHVWLLISLQITEKMESSRPCVDKGFASHMMKTLARYRDSSTFSDVTVVVGTREFQCHRMILAATSEFFRLALVSRGMKEDLERKITLKTIDEVAFSNILTYVYCGEIDITEQQLFSVWQAAHLLQITFIIKECEQFFRNTLCLENCLEYFCGAALLDEQSHLYATDFIADNFVHARHLESFSGLERNELKLVMSSKKLNIEHEDDLIEFLLKWTEDDPRNDTSNVSPAYCADNPVDRYSVKNVPPGQASVASNLDEPPDLEVKQPDPKPPKGPTRAQQLADLLEYTRYFLMSRSFLNESLSYHPFIRADPRCVALVEQISRYSSRSYLHQEWCPPAAVHRERSKRRNVLVSVKNNLFSHPQQELYLSTPFRSERAPRGIPYNERYNMNQHMERSRVSHDESLCYERQIKKGLTLVIFDILSEVWLEYEIPEVCLIELNSCPLQMLYHEEKIYFSDTDGNIMVHWIGTKALRKLGQHRILVSSLCIVGDWLYSCSEKQKGRTIINRIGFHDLHKLSDGELSSQQFGLLDIDAKSVLTITSIANTLAIFCRCRDGIYIIFFDLFYRRSKVVLTELRVPSKNHFITMRNDKEVFVLEEHGHFWRIRRCPRTKDFEIVHELMLWDERWLSQAQLQGAALVNDALYVVLYHKQHEHQPAIKANLEGVFDHVILVYPKSSQGLYSAPFTSNVIHTVLPQAVSPTQTRDSGIEGFSSKVVSVKTVEDYVRYPVW